MKKKEKLKFLILEDYKPDAELNIMYLKKEKLDFDYEVVVGEKDFKQQIIDFKPDLILSDYSLPQYDGMRALQFVANHYPEIPFIMVTGSLDEETAVECMKQGAWDYVIKEHLVRLGPAVKNSLLRRKQILEKKAAEAARKISERKFEQFADLLPEIVCETDLTGNLTYTNKKSFDTFGYTEQDFKQGINIFDIIVPKQRTRTLQNMKLLMDNKLTRSDEYLVQRKDGTAFPAIIHANVNIQNSKPVGMRAVVVDITEQKKNEDLIKQREEELQLMIENSPIGVSSTDLNGNFLSVNDAYCKMLGYSCQELLSMHFDDITHPEDKHNNDVLYSDLVQGKINYFDLEKRYIRKTGETIFCRLRSQLVRNNENKPLFEIAVIEDITERKKAVEKLKEREEFNYALFQQNPIETLVVDKDGKILQFNSAVERNRSRIPNIGDILYKDFAAEHEIDMYKILKETIRTGKAKNINESKYKEKYFSIQITPFKEGAIVTSKDITQIKIAEQELLKSLNEKDLLLREVHHRVNNNMQIISSMMKLQQRHTDNEQAITIIKKSFNRVRSMAMVHERLYRTKDFEAIEFNSYLLSLAANIFESYKIDKDKVSLEINDQILFMNINQAIPCGLIMNELITNCVKHAFKKNKVGKIRIDLNKLESGKFIFSISDDGSGLPQEVDLANPQNLGLQLVDALISQLKAEFTVERKNGTKFTITF